MADPQYSKGYAAGRRRQDLDRKAERDERARQAFKDRAFLTALQFFLAAEGWQMGGKPVSTLDQRIELANRCAIRALALR